MTRTNKTSFLGNLIIALGLGASLFTAACQLGGKVTGPTLVDSNGDLASDGVDVDDDGRIDYTFDGTTGADRSLDSGQCASLFDMLLDLDGDGLFDELDLDCDGRGDISLIPVTDGPPSGDAPGSDIPPPPPPSGDAPGSDIPPPPPPSGSPSGGATASCSASSSVNGETYKVECTGDGASSQCTCSANGVQVSTCTMTGALVCSINNGCCDF